MLLVYQTFEVFQSKYTIKTDGVLAMRVSDVLFGGMRLVESGFDDEIDFQGDLGRELQYYTNQRKAVLRRQKAVESERYEVKRTLEVGGIGTWQASVIEEPIKVCGTYVPAAKTNLPIVQYAQKMDAELERMKKLLTKVESKIRAIEKAKLPKEIALSGTKGSGSIPENQIPQKIYIKDKARTKVMRTVDNPWFLNPNDRYAGPPEGFDWSAADLRTLKQYNVIMDTCKRNGFELTIMFAGRSPIRQNTTSTGHIINSGGVLWFVLKEPTGTVHWVNDGWNRLWVNGYAMSPVRMMRQDVTTRDRHFQHWLKK